MIKSQQCSLILIDKNASCEIDRENKIIQLQCIVETFKSSLVDFVKIIS